MRRIEIGLALVALVTTLCMFLFPDSYFGMLLRSFAYQGMIACLFLFVWLVFRKQWKWAGMPMVSILLLNLLVGPVMDSPAENNLEAPGIRVAHFNVLKYTSSHDSTVRRALETEADLISFQEVDAAWAQSLANGLVDAYPHYRIEAREDAFGLAVFSKTPLTEVDTFQMEGIPNLSGTLEWKGESIRFFTSHLKSPLNYDNFQARNRHMEALADHVERVDGPVLVIGDFNTVPWDASLLAFRKDTNLIDSRKDLSATYPSGLSFARIPIDYIFHSEEMRCEGFATLPATSSDHLGIVGVYSIHSL